jgi:hypothetical protein
MRCEYGNLTVSTCMKKKRAKNSRENWVTSMETKVGRIYNFNLFKINPFSGKRTIKKNV